MGWGSAASGGFGGPGGFNHPPVPTYESATRTNLELAFGLEIFFLKYFSSLSPGLMERALGSGLEQPSDYLQLWRSYCIYERRRIDWNEVDLANPENGLFCWLHLGNCTVIIPKNYSLFFFEKRAF